jgi:hypothetical protein
MSSAFGPVRQVGYVVSDSNAATDFWVRVAGAGPFFTLPNYEVANCEYAGSRSSPRLSIAIGYSGSLQIELLQPLDEEVSLYRELARSPLAGPHYVTYWVEDLGLAVNHARELGCEVVQSGGIAGAGRFTYLKAANGPLFELLETNDMIRGWFGSMQAAAEGWDGERPLRPAFG